MLKWQAIKLCYLQHVALIANAACFAIRKSIQPRQSKVKAEFQALQTHYVYRAWDISYMGISTQQKLRSSIGAFVWYGPQISFFQM